MTENPRPRLQFNIRQALVLVTCLAVAIEICSIFLRKPYPTADAVGLFYFSVLKPLLLGAVVGAGLGVLAKDPFFGAIAGLTVGSIVSLFLV